MWHRHYATDAGARHSSHRRSPRASAYGCSAVYFVGEAAQDLQSFLELSPMYAPRRDNEVGDFVDSLWRSVSGRRSRAWLKRGADEASQKPASQTPEACPTAADQGKNVPMPSYYTAKEIRTSDRVVSFPRLN